MNIKDCFAIFSLHYSAKEPELKTEYRKLVKLYHPDSTSGKANRKKFEEIQLAYETILAFYEYSENNIFENISVKDSKLERIRKAQQRQRQKREDEFKILQTAILNYKKSFKYKFSSSIAILSFLLGVSIYLDSYLPAKIEYEPIQGVEFSSDKNTPGTLFAKDKIFEITNYECNNLKKYNYVLIASSPIFKDVISIHTKKGIYERNIVFNNSKYRFVFAITIFLFIGIIMFLVKNKETAGYFFLIKYYNGYVLPLIFFFILLSDARVFYLLRIF